MLDQETLRPVIIAMSLYIATSVLVPRFATRPTNLEPVDDIVAFLVSQRGSIMPGTIVGGTATHSIKNRDRKSS